MTSVKISLIHVFFFQHRHFAFPGFKFKVIFYGFYLRSWQSKGTPPRPPQEIAGPNKALLRVTNDI